jgi:hypothetical protein
MTLRTIDWAEINSDVHYEVKYTLNSFGGTDLEIAFNAMEEWIESFATDRYIMFLQTIVFNSEQDALMFKLGHVT